MGKKDILLKDYFTPERFADAFNAIVFNGQKVVDPAKIAFGEKETCIVENKENETLADVRFRDNIKVVELTDAIYCLMAIEHQAQVDPTMVLRVMEYDVREYLRQMKEGNAKLKPVITLVMYWKHNKWKYATTLREMFDEVVLGYLEEHDLNDYIPDYRMNIFTPEGATIDKLNCFATDLKDIIAYVKYSKNKDKLRKYANDNDTELNRESVALINELTNSDLKIEEGKETVKMCKAIEDIREEGRQEGSIIGFITACREFDKTDDEIMQLITDRYSIDINEVRRLMREV
jgi:hypothetical protein